MANEKKISGSDYALFIDPAGGIDYKLIVCLTEQNYNRATNKIDAKSKCGPDSLPGAQEVDIDFKGQIVFVPSNGTISEFVLNNLWADKTTIGWKMARVIPQAGDSVYSGTAFISKLNASYGLDSVSTFDGALGIFGLPTAVQMLQPPAVSNLVLTFNTDHFEFTFDPAVGYDFVSVGNEYSLDGGTTWNFASPEGPNSFANTGHADGQFLVRVAAGPSYIAGIPLSYGPVLFVPATPEITAEDHDDNFIAFVQSYGSLAMEYSIDSGTTWTSPAATPITITADLAIGAFKLRVKRTAPALRDNSAAASNTTEFTV